MKHNEIKKMCLSIVTAFGVTAFGVTAFGIALLFHPAVSQAGNARTFLPVVSKSGISKSSILKNKTTILPSLSFPQTDFVFSKVLEGKAVLHTFVVKNKGAAILKIYKVKPG